MKNSALLRAFQKNARSFFHSKAAPLIFGTALVLYANLVGLASCVFAGKARSEPPPVSTLSSVISDPLWPEPLSLENPAQVRAQDVQKTKPDRYRKLLGKILYYAIETHLVLSFIGIWAHYYDTKKGGEKFFAHETLSPEKLAMLQQELKRILSENKDLKFLLVGEIHTDMRTREFLGDRATVQMLAEHGFTGYFPEYPPEFQKRFDGILNHKMKLSKLDSLYAKSDPNRERTCLYNMLTNAHAFKMKVYASDLTKFDFFFRYTMFAIYGAAWLLDVARLTPASDWIMENGYNLPFSKGRVREKKTAKFCLQQVPPLGKGMVLRGQFHVIADCPDSLRRQLPGCVTLSCGPSLKDYASLMSESDRIKVEPPDYVADFSTGRITPPPQP